MQTEKRKVRSYKVSDKPYNKALARGQKKNNNPLANTIEDVVKAYADGLGIYAKDKHGNWQPIAE